MSIEFIIESRKDIVALVNAIHLLDKKPQYLHIIERATIRETEEIYHTDWNAYYRDTPTELFHVSHGIPIADYWYFRTNCAYKRGEEVKMGPVQEIVYQAMINQEMVKE